jgi:CHAT domain-containing protein
MARFYELHMGAGLAPLAALSRAQAWLRQATDVDLDAYAKVAAAQGRLESRHIAEIERARTARGPARSHNRRFVESASPDATQSESKIKLGAGNADRRTAVTQPYAHPYYWAGFILTGL